MKLIIGNKNYSSWSLRPWILLKHSRIKFDEVRIPLFTSEGDLMLDELCPAKQVPVLYDGRLVLWDSLAICEYIADKFPDKRLLPELAQDRARARAMSAEMHSGFVALRNEHPMNCHRVFPMGPSVAVQADLDRLAVLWQYFENADKPEGEFLCGEFSIVDAMFAPVAWRAKGYGLSISPVFERWSTAMMALPAMQQWVDEGASEHWRVESTEMIGVL